MDPEVLPSIELSKRSITKHFYSHLLCGLAPLMREREREENDMYFQKLLPVG